MLEATRPIGIVHVVDRVTANQSLTSGIDQRLQQLRYNNRTSVLDSSVSFDCRHNLTVSLYLPQRLHSNPPSAGLGAVSKNLHHKKPPFFFYLNIFIFFFSLTATCQDQSCQRLDRLCTNGRWFYSRSCPLNHRGIHLYLIFLWGEDVYFLLVV